MRARRKKELKQKASATRIIRNFNTWETFWKPLAIRWLLILYLAQFWTYIDNFATWQIFIDVNGQILNKKFVLSHCLGHFRDHHLILPPPFEALFISVTKIFLMGQPLPLFGLFFVLFKQTFNRKNCRIQWDSNLDCRTTKQDCSTLDHPHGHGKNIFLCETGYLSKMSIVESLVQCRKILFLTNTSQMGG